MVRKIVESLLETKGSTEDFTHNLSLVMKTGNTEDVINVIRRRLSIVGLGYNLVPYIRLVKKSTAEIQSYFTAMCELERTFSGFRCNLIKCVEIASYFLFGSNEIRDLRVDIWGDGCEIGGVETTRIAFRILTDKIKCQSSNAVFCFAAYRGKDSRFAMEQNLGPTLAGVQESGWLFNKTFELSNRGVKLTYSGDSPFLIRLILGITNETSSPSRMPLHVTDPQYTPTKCDPKTGLRSDVAIPFRTDLPKSSLVYFENVQSDKEELLDAKEGSIGDLFEGVWGAADIVLGSEERAHVQCVKVLRNWYPNLFDKDNPKQVGSGDKFISAYDACELLRHSFNQCVLCLRSEEFNCDTFKKWAETYYQTSVLIFGHAGLTPYKL